MWCQGLRLTQQSWDKRALHQMFNPDLEKAKEPDQRSNCQHPLDHRKSKRIPEKHLLLLHWLCQSFCGSQQTGIFLRRWEYQTKLPASWETCMQVKKQQLEPDMEKQTGSKLGKECVESVYCHPIYLTYAEYIMQNVEVDKSQAGIKTAWKNIN